MSRKGKKDKKLRFRRTKKEIRMGLTSEEAKRAREKMSKTQKRVRTVFQEKVELIKTLQSRFGLAISSPSSESVVPEYSKNKKFADTQEVLDRIRKNAAEEVAQDSLLNPRQTRISQI